MPSKVYVKTEIIESCYQCRHYELLGTRLAGVNIEFCHLISKPIERDVAYDGQLVVEGKRIPEGGIDARCTLRDYVGGVCSCCGQ